MHEDVNSRAKRHADVPPVQGTEEIKKCGEICILSPGQAARPRAF